MKLTNEQLTVIEKYVDEALVDKEKLIQYLEKHRIIKNEVFPRCSKVKKRDFPRDEAYCSDLESERGFRPLSRETFVRRIPFFFYTILTSSGDRHIAPLWYALPYDPRESLNDEELERIYTDLEYMFYDLDLSLEVIFGYVSDQLYPPSTPKKRTERDISKRYSLMIADIASHTVSEKSRLSTKEVFVQWRHYLRLCQVLGWRDYTPDRFITAYNYALEAVGQDPVIYFPALSISGDSNMRFRNTFVFKGNFPCDSEGNPILRWTNLKVTFPKSVTFNGIKSHFGELTIVASPRSKIYERGLLLDDIDRSYYDLDSQEWECLYVGPQNMNFNYHALKEFREECDLTQKELAEAIDVSVRTYQKWEAGTTMPDCNNLIRIMHWLGIDDVQQLIEYDEE